LLETSKKKTSVEIIRSRHGRASRRPGSLKMVRKRYKNLTLRSKASMAVKETKEGQELHLQRKEKK